MFSFGKRSMENLSEAHPRLQEIFSEVVKHYDCSIIEGHRTIEEQEKLYAAGKSKLRRGKHNMKPSEAVDVVPYPIDWNDKERFYHFAGFVKGIATSLGYKIRWGGDWDSDNDLDDQTFYDLPHFEVID